MKQHISRYERCICKSLGDVTYIRPAELSTARFHCLLQSTQRFSLTQELKLLYEINKNSRKMGTLSLLITNLRKLLYNLRLWNVHYEST